MLRPAPCTHSGARVLMFVRDAIYSILTQCSYISCGTAYFAQAAFDFHLAAWNEYLCVNQPQNLSAKASSRNYLRAMCAVYAVRAEERRICREMNVAVYCGMFANSLCVARCSQSNAIWGESMWSVVALGMMSWYCRQCTQWRLLHFSGEGIDVASLFYFIISLFFGFKSKKIEKYL